MEIEKKMGSVKSAKYLILGGAVGLGLFVASCAQVNVPDARNVDIPTPVSADQRREAVNERPDSVIYLPLGDDILVPEVAHSDPLPYEMVGPFELRGETLAGALQLILADYDVGLAFEAEGGINKRITVANLSGELSRVVHRICSLADVYCSFEEGTLIVKDKQTFTVTLPPLGENADGSEYISSVSSGLAAIIGETPVADDATRTLVYNASQRNAEMAERYFQRLRANTALIIFETYIWEVSLDAGNSTGIKWETLDELGKFNISAAVNGSVAGDFTNPISIGLPTTQTIGVNPADIIQFISQFGAVKTISQPQMTVLSGAQAELRVADTQNYVSEVSTTFNDTQSTTSVNTDSVDSGFTLTIGSSWDKATVYANISIELTNVLDIEDFTFSDGGDGGTSTVIQLPQTTEREMLTQIRVRPGDSVLIGGLVRETDNFNSDGPGFMEPVLPSSRTARTENLELVVMMRPRVVVYTDPDDARYLNFVTQKHEETTALSSDMAPKSVLETHDSLDEVKAKKVSIDSTPVSPAVQTSPVSPVAPVPVVPEPVVKGAAAHNEVVTTPSQPVNALSSEADEPAMATMSDFNPVSSPPATQYRSVRPAYSSVISPAIDDDGDMSPPGMPPAVATLPAQDASSKLDNVVEQAASTPVSVEEPSESVTGSVVEDDGDYFAPKASPRLSEYTDIDEGEAASLREYDARTSPDTDKEARFFDVPMPSDEELTVSEEPNPVTVYDIEEESAPDAESIPASTADSDTYVSPYEMYEYYNPDN